MRASLLLCASLLVLPNAADAAAKRRVPLRLVASQVNGEPVLRYGTQTINRPFGATLVDRLDVVGTYALRTGRTYLVRGSAAGPCPVQYVVIEMTAATPRPSTPFGTCADGARGRISRGALFVTVPGGGGALPAQFAYASGQITPLSGPTLTSGAAAAPTLDDPWAGPGGCATAARVDAPAAAELMSNFERGYPADWRRPNLIKRVDLDPERLRRAVVGLACLSTWPAADPSVPQAALPLFASKRHGKLAFELLDGVARDGATPPDVRAAARSFHAEMRFRVERREPI